MAIPPHSPLLFLLSAPRTQFSERATQATTVDGYVWWEWFLSPMWDTLLYLQYRILWSVAQLQRNQYSIRFHAVSLQHFTLQMDIKEYNNKNKQNTNTVVQLFTNICSKAMWNHSPHPLWSLCRRGWRRTVLQGFVKQSQMAEKNKKLIVNYFI